MDAGAAVVGDETRGRRVGRLRGVERQADRALAALDHAALDQPVGVDQLEGGLGVEAEHRAIEQERAVELAARHDLGDMVDADEAAGGRRPRRRPARHEVDVVDAAVLAEPIDQVDQAALEAADRRDHQLVGADAAAKDLRPVAQRALDRALGVVDPECERADRGAVLLDEGAGERLLLGVEDQVDVALAVQAHVLRLVAGRRAGTPWRRTARRGAAASRRRPRTRRTRRRCRPGGAGGASVPATMPAAWGRRRRQRRRRAPPRAGRASAWRRSRSGAAARRGTRR